MQSFVSSVPLKAVISSSYCIPKLTDNYTYTLGVLQQNNYMLPSPGGRAQRMTTCIMLLHHRRPLLYRFKLHISAHLSSTQ